MKPKLRKREIVIALAAGALASATAASILLDVNEPSSAPETTTIAAPAAPQGYEVEDFDQIATIGPQNVIVTTGEDASVRAEGSAEAIARFDVVVEDGRLEIRPKEDFDGDWDMLEDVTFYVTARMLEEVTLAGSGDIQVDQVKGNSFSGTVAGPGELKIAKMHVINVDFTIGAAGNIIAAGDANDVRVTIGAAGSVEANGLDTATANISIGGAGDVALSVQDRARIAILGTGDVDITGQAQCSVSKLGAGEVTCNGRAIGN